MTKWLEDRTKDEDVVISTRLRIARNLLNYKFPSHITSEESDRLTEEILDAIKEGDRDNNYRFLRISDLSNRDRQMYVEGHLISPTLLQKSNKSSFLLREDEKVTIMINEEDHLRIQILMSGFNLDEGWKICSSIDDIIESKVKYAFHRDLGYLTACPTNVGTGLRASVMVHLPCVSMTGHINTIIEALRRIGLTARGIYGEGSKALGHFYQISNQTTLGESEEEIISKLTRVISQIINKERSTRIYLLDKNKVELEDRIFRSLGILRYSRKMSSREAMNHLSNVKLGLEMGIIKEEGLENIVELMVKIQPANVQKYFNIDMDKEERDIKRTEMIRKTIKELEG